MTTGPRLAIVTPGGLDTDARRRLVSSALAAVPIGSALVLLRDRALGGDDIREAARILAPICAAREATLFVPIGDGDVDGTGAIGPARLGWHFTDQPDTPARLARARADAGDLAAISVSTHDPITVAALAGFADVVYLGPVWATPEKPRPLGLDAIERAARITAGARARLFAIGGITSAARVRDALAHGADGVAGIRHFAAPTIAALEVATRPPSSV